MTKELGPWLIGGGLLLVVLGVLAWTGALSWFGRLPGDIQITSQHGRIYIPITSMLIISAILNVLAWLLILLLRR